MTGVTSVGGASNSELIQMLQELARKRAEQAEASRSSQLGQSGGADRASFEDCFEQALLSAGLDASKLEEVQAEIKSAVSEAVSGSDGSTDPREAARQAIDSTLEKYGVDTAQLRESMDAMRPQGPPPGGGPGGPGGPGGAGGPGGGIAEALDALGVDSSKTDEIHSAIESAIESARSTDGSDDREAVKSAVHEVLDGYGIDSAAFDAQMEAGRAAPGQGSAMMGGLAQGASLLSFLNESGLSASSSNWLLGLMQLVDVQA